jgi:hypothetical protein
MLCLLAALAVGYSHPAPVLTPWWSDDGSQVFTTDGKEVKAWTPEGKLIGLVDAKKPVGYTFGDAGTSRHKLAIEGEPDWEFGDWEVSPKGTHHLLALRYSRSNKRIYMLWQSYEWKGQDQVKMKVNSISRGEKKPHMEAEWWQACKMPDFSEASLQIDTLGHPWLLLPEGTKTILRNIAFRLTPDITLDEDCTGAGWQTSFNNDILLSQRKLGANNYLWRAYRFVDSSLVGEKKVGWVKHQPFTYLALAPDGKHVAGRGLEGDPAGSARYRAWISGAGSGATGLDSAKKALEDQSIQSTVDTILLLNQRTETTEDIPRPREYAVFKDWDASHTFIEENTIDFPEGNYISKLPRHPLEAGVEYSCFVVFDSVGDDNYGVSPSLFRTSDGLQTDLLTPGDGKVKRLQDRKTLVGGAIPALTDSQMPGGVSAEFVVKHTGMACKARARLYRSTAVGLRFNFRVWAMK